jgi:hypothetical protein
MKIGQRVYRQVFARNQDARGIREEGNRRKIVDRIIERLLIEIGNEPEHREPAQQEGIAVGRGLGGATCAGHAAGPAHIFDHHLLPQHLAQARRRDTANCVHGAACGIGDHHREGPRRPDLRQPRAHGGEGRDERGSARDQAQNKSPPNLHRLPQIPLATQHSEMRLRSSIRTNPFSIQLIPDRAPY